jgi:farnesyl diphosphate synthase
MVSDADRGQHSPLSDWIASRCALVEQALEHVLPAASLLPMRLHEAMRYATLGGGKRMRPLLCFAAGELVAAHDEALAYAGAAVELIHAYSLVHDDLPSMDDDTLRRGLPSCHVAFDEATALLVGDSLQSLAFQVLSERRLTTDPQRQLEMVKLLAAAAGSRGMAGGQAIDLAAVGQELSVPELELMHIHKTGALIRAAIWLGASCGTALPDEFGAHLDRFAKFAGLAFQVVDDILDVQSNTATLGKTIGKDARHNKPTYVSVLGLQRSRELAEELRAQALSALAMFASEADRLRSLTEYIVLRKH